MPAYLFMSVANAMHEKVPSWKVDGKGNRYIEVRDQNKDEKVYLFIPVTENQKKLVEVPLATKKCVKRD